MSTPEEVAAVVAMIGSAYPNFSGTKETVMVYYELLKDLPGDLLKISTLQCCAEAGRKFAPSVGEIRGTASDIQRRAQSVPSTLDAWNEVCSAPRPYPADYVIYRGGEIVPHPVYQWSHPLVEKTAKQFGWPDFPNYENLSTDRAHFFKQYEAAQQHQEEINMALPETTRFIEATKRGELTTGQAITRLADGMKK